MMNVSVIWQGRDGGVDLRVYIGDLEGLKVSHDMDQLNEGEDRILTLKDSRILDNEGK
jgi:hypothetical protein